MSLPEFGYVLPEDGDEGENPTADPTWIAMKFDPREQRMFGTARHGNTPFNVPYISQIDECFWQGGCSNGLILPENIEHLISLYQWEEYTVAHGLKSKLVVEMYDSLDQSMSQVYALADWINSCRQDGPTLVHCQAGLNRSGLVAATALIREGLDPQDAIDLLREKRSPAVLCNTAFVDWLLEQ